MSANPVIPAHRQRRELHERYQTFFPQDPSPFKNSDDVFFPEPALIKTRARLLRLADRAGQVSQGKQQSSAFGEVTP